MVRKNIPESYQALDVDGEEENDQVDVGGKHKSVIDGEIVRVENQSKATDRLVWLHEGKTHGQLKAVHRVDV